MPYINFTDEEKQRARSVDIVSLLESQGEKLKHSGSEYEWNNGGEKVTIRGNIWYNQYARKGGDAVAFVRKFYNKNYAEAVQFLLNGDAGSPVEYKPIAKEPKEIKPLVPPAKNADMRRVFAYLTKQRKVDADIVASFAHEGLLYEDAKYHNAVFVGKDSEGNIRHISKRGTISSSTYKGTEAGSQPEYSFHWIGKSNKLYIFEAPIDLLSYISMNKENWKKHSYVALCSVADRALFYILEHYPQIKEVVMCLDSDEAGQSASQRIAEKLIEKGYEYDIEIPHGKDWNEELCVLKEAEDEDLKLAAQSF